MRQKIETEAERQAEVVVFTWLKLRHLRLAKWMRLSALVCEEFGLDHAQFSKIYNKAYCRLQKIGVPHSSQEMESPCHSRDGYYRKAA